MQQYQYEEISVERIRQLLELYVSPEEWEEATSFMQKMYGEQAHILTVSVDPGEEYDDEHEYYTSGIVTCLDHNRMILEMNPAYCKEIIHPLQSTNTRFDESVPVAIHDEEVQETVFSYEAPLLPIKNATYIIDQPPTPLPIFAIRKEQ